MRLSPLHIILISILSSVGLAVVFFLIKTFTIDRSVRRQSLIDTRRSLLDEAFSGQD